MSGKVSSKIVTDGLVLYLDSGNPNSYISGSTIWNDLTNINNNVNLINGPTFSTNKGGNIVFDGTNDYVDTNIGMMPTSTTVEVICSITSNTSTKTGGNTVAQYIVFRQNTRISNFEGVVLNYLESGLTGYFNLNMSSVAGVTKTVTTPLINFNEIYTITGVYDSTNLTIYLNGQFISQMATGFPIDYNLTQTYKIGRANAIGQAFDGYLNGKIYNVKIYNKSLTSEEILQNYNALKNRYI